MTEKFLPVPTFPRYEVGDEGTVRAIDTGRVLKAFPHEKGYLQVNLNDNNARKKFYLHRLVAEVHIPGFSIEREVGFHDQNPKNCRVSNLYISEKARGCGLEERLISKEPKGPDSIRKEVIFRVSLAGWRSNPPLAVIQRRNQIPLGASYSLQREVDEETGERSFAHTWVWYETPIPEKEN